MHNGANQPLIEVKDLKEYFNISMGMFKSKPLKAVDGVIFHHQQGRDLGSRRRIRLRQNDSRPHDSASL